MTNFEKIKENMTVEKFAELFANPYGLYGLVAKECIDCPLDRICAEPQKIKEWLESEVEENGGL